MAEELQKAFGAKANIIPGRKGVFDVIVDGELAFSKHETGRFPQPGELADKLKP
ncbi:Rdx family protein [Chloroflexota bacterium]